MNKLDCNDFNKANSAIQDCISAAGIADLRKIGQALDDLKSMVEDNMYALAWIGGDY